MIFAKLSFLYVFLSISITIKKGPIFDMNRLFLNEPDSNNEPNSNSDRGDKKSPPKKNFKVYKKNAINSLNDVEHFLNNFQHYFKYFKLYKTMKKF